MKTRHTNCVVAAAAAAAAGVGASGGSGLGGVGISAGAGTNCGSASVAAGKMKSVILYPYGPLTGAGCCRMLHAKNLAITSAIYTINISLLIVLIYCWRINVNIQRSGDLEDVYYGVQIAYFAIIGTQMSMIVLSIMLIFGIYRENPGLIVPWIIGFITFMALEAVAMVYSNVLRDHVNKQFDAMCKAEVAFFIARAFINVLAMWGVLRFYNLVRSGITWKGPEAKTALTAAGEGHGHGTAGGIGAGRMHGSGAYRRNGGNGRYCGRHRYHSENYIESSRATGCCSFLDFDDYDDEDDEDDDDYNGVGGDYDYDDYYDDDDDGDDGIGTCYGDCNARGLQYNSVNDEDDFNDDDAGSDCAMLGSKSSSSSSSSSGGSMKRARHCIMTSNGRGRGHGHRHRPRSNNNIRSVLINKRQHKYKIAQPQTRLEVINESERSAGSGSDENDSLLAAYDSSSSLTSV